MNTIEAIMTRRSVRNYTARSVDEEVVNKLLAAAMHAPSAGNQQPWCFIVVDDPVMLKEVPSFSPYAAMCARAPLGILVCADLALEKHQGLWVQDCSAATENLLLAAHELGLGAVWTAVYPREERMLGFRALLNLPDQVMPFSFVVLGYPDKVPPRQDRLKPDRIHRNGWQQPHLPT